jgi:hypothetical protein
MKRFRFWLLTASSVLFLGLMASAHPHFRKTVIARISDTEIKLEFTTYPWNPAHLSEVKGGFLFHCGNALLETNKPVKVGTTEIPAGKYQLRARAKDLSNWTFLLIPAPPDRNTPPDMAKAIELKTLALSGRQMSDHLSLDVSPGHGDTDGKALLVLSWGDRQLQGELADFVEVKQ